MRTSTLFAGAALVASAFASPMVKRDLEIDTVYDVSYQTVTLTETEGAATAATVAATTSTVAAVPTTSAVSITRHGHRHSKAASSSVISSASSSSVAEKVVASVAISSAAPASTSSAAAAEGWTSTWASTWVITPSANTEVASSTPSTTSTTAVASSAAAYSAASTSEASKTSSATTGTATTYQEIVLAHHNVHRANHSADALTWDTDLASTAATIAATCVYAHSMDVNGGGYGQNIAAGVESSNVSAVITELFYNGEVGYFADLYGEANPDMTNFEKWGHFSQLVWKGTTKVGCATQYCSGGLSNVASDVSPYFTVCNYGDPGNYAGEYADNIGDSLGESTQSWSYDL